MARRGQDGFALPMVLLVVVLLATIAGGVAWEAASTMRGAGDGGQDVQAFHLASAGLEFALANLRSNPAFSGQSQALGAGTFNVTVQPSGSDLLLTSTGTVGPARHVQSMRLRRSLPPQYRRRIFTTSSLTLDEVIVDGDVYSGGDVRLRKKTNVTGRVEAVGTVRLDGGKAGSVAQGVPAEALPPVDFMALRGAATILYTTDMALTGNQTYNNDIVFVDGDLTLAGRITGRVTFVVTGSVNIERPLRPADGNSGIAVIAQREISVDKGTSVSALLISQRRVEIKKQATLNGNAIAPRVSVDSEVRLSPPAGADPASLPGLPATSLEVVDWSEVTP